MELFGRRFDTGRPVRLDVAGGRISQISDCEEAESPDRWPWISPGLLDLQANGYGGQEFTSLALTPEKVADIARTYSSFGVTRFLPTVTTQSRSMLEHSLRTIDEACRSMPELASQIVGVHLEGPYLTREDGASAAHPLEHCRRPDWDEFQALQDASGGRIRIHTMSVEFDESPDFVRKVVAGGVIVAIGHTAADSDHTRRAVDAGARLSTHLGNGAHGVIRRHPNYIWDQLAEDRLVASLIVDGHHLPPQVVKTFVRAKTPARCILVSDLSGMAGLPPGHYKTGLGDREMLPGGKLVVAGQRQILAGATRPIGTAVANVIHFAGVDLATAVHMAATHPATLLGIHPGRLEPGEPADLVQFDLVTPSTEREPSRFQNRATVSEGRLLWGTPWRP